jgi:hypothetical protein
LVYGTTPVFLRCFSLLSLDELPALPKTNGESAAFHTNGEQEEAGMAADEYDQGQMNLEEFIQKI